MTDPTKTARPMEQSTVLAALAVSGNRQAVQNRVARLGHKANAERTVSRRKRIDQLQRILLFWRTHGVSSDVSDVVESHKEKLNDLLPVVPKFDRFCARKVLKQTRYANSIKASISRFKDAERRAVEA